MAFIDNPIIAELGNQLGLGGVFAAASGSAPAPPKVVDSKPNIPNYRERPYIPHNEMGTTKGGVRSGGDNPVLPGQMSSDTLQSPQVQSLLGQYGVTPPTTPPDPNLFIHNPAAFANHPVISGLIERGLGGLAYSHPGDNFLQSLVGGVKGMQEYNAARGAQVNNQLMAPFNQASEVQKLQDASQTSADEHAKAQSEVEYQRGLLAHYTAMDATRQERLAALPPRYDPKTGQPSYAKDDGKGNISYEPDPNWEENPHDAFTRQYYEAKKLELIDEYGSIDKIPADKILGVLTGADTAESFAKGAAGTKDATIRANATLGAASIRGGGRAVSPGDKLTYNNLDQEGKQIESELREAQVPGRFLTDETGSSILPMSARGKVLIQKKQQRLTEIKAQKAALAAKYGGSSGPTIPDGADGVWDPVQHKTIYKGQ